MRLYFSFPRPWIYSKCVRNMIKKRQSLDHLLCLSVSLSIYLLPLPHQPSDYRVSSSYDEYCLSPPSALGPLRSSNYVSITKNFPHLMTNCMRNLSPFTAINYSNSSTTHNERLFLNLTRFLTHPSTTLPFLVSHAIIEIPKVSARV